MKQLIAFALVTAGALLAQLPSAAVLVELDRDETVLSGPSAIAGVQARKPNVVLIVADDLGYADLGVQGCKDIPTPNIDSIARNGARFTNGYVTCPVCSPTRAGLLTGRYQQRFGHEFNPGPAQFADPNFGLPVSEATLAERLKSAGYATGMFGKWHLGYRTELQPPKRGFDEFFGFLGGAHAYTPGAGQGRNNPIRRGMIQAEEREYLTEAFAREAVAFVERHKKAPFFLYLAFNAVHAPLQASEKYLSRFVSIKDDNRRTLAAMLSAMDEAVGRVLAKLREERLEEETLIFFISDNGGPTPQTTSRNVPLRGYKGQVLEGGIRIPYMMQWKGRIPAGSVYDRPVVALDIHATAIAAAGLRIAPEWKLDGTDLLPYLTDTNRGVPHDRLFWRFGEQWAVRMGDWKLAQAGRGSPQLFNLAEDIGEKNDLFAKEPGKVKQLSAAYSEWNAQLIAPRWLRETGTPRRNRE